MPELDTTYAGRLNTLLEIHYLRSPILHKSEFKDLQRRAMENKQRNETVVMMNEIYKKRVYKAVGAFFVVFVFLLAFVAGVSAFDWKIAGGSVGNYSAVQGFADFRYQYAVNESDLPFAIGTGCGPTAYVYSSNPTACALPTVANRTDFGVFTNGGFLWWHPVASGGAMIKFTAPNTSTYQYNVTFYKYTGGSNVQFFVKLNGYSGTTLNSTTLGGGATADFRGTVSMTAGETLVFYNYDNDGTAGDSAGIMLNISAPNPLIVSNFTITARDAFNLSSINNFSVEVRNTNYSTTSGTITTNIYNNDTTPVNMFFFGVNQGGGYYNETVTGWNASLNYQADLDKLFRFYGITYSNFTAHSGVNYTRTLGYKFNYTCPSFSNASLYFLVGGNISNTFTATCSNDTTSNTAIYAPSVEGAFVTGAYFNTSYATPQNNRLTSNESFTADLFDPVATVAWNITSGFTNPSIQVNLTCTDTITPTILYNLSFNGNLMFYGNKTNGTTQTNTTSGIDGTNTAVGVCSDFFSSDTDTLSNTVYFKQIILIDELNNILFDVANLTRVRVYFDDNSSYYDFKANNTARVNVTTTGLTKLRFDLGYLNDVTITRWVDISLLNTSVRVCANKEGVTHYEQLIISATQRPTILKSVFSDCVIAADYTRFAYQDAFLLKAYSITTLYYLYTFEGISQILLASVDGSVSSYINLDTLEFKQTAYNFNIQSDALSFSKTGASQVQIYYQNLKNDNTALRALIYRMDTGALVLNTSSFADPNEFTLYFDYSPLNNVTNETLFRLELQKTTSDGSSIIKRYFNTNASNGTLNNGVALTISILLTIFGLTFAATRATFGWFGIVIMLASIAVLTFAVGGVWYITFLQAIDLIIAVFIILSMVRTGSGTVA